MAHALRFQPANPETDPRGVCLLVNFVHADKQNLSRARLGAHEQAYEAQTQDRILEAYFRDYGTLYVPLFFLGQLFVVSRGWVQCG